MADDEDDRPKINVANIDDEFLRHPHTGAFVRNPLLDKSKSTPIIFQHAEFNHNCLEAALQDYQSISVSESTFKAMTMSGISFNADPASGTLASSGSTGSLRSTLARAALGTLRHVAAGYEFVVLIKKSTYVPPRTNRRRPIEARTNMGQIVDKLNVEVTDVAGRVLRVEAVHEGLIGVWNRTNPAFEVRQGDSFVKVNLAKSNASAMIEEMANASDVVRITVRRSPPERRSSKAGDLSRLPSKSGQGEP